MRTAAVAALVVCLAILGFAAGPADETCALTLSLLDESTGQELPGLVRIRDAEGRLLQPAELLPRGLGLKEKLLESYGGRIHDWFVLPKGTTIRVPRDVIQIDAISGLETEMASERLNLAGVAATTRKFTLLRFSDARSRGLCSANTHLHLMKLGRADADRYLTEVPRADDLDVLFVSYLERAGADQDYISNRYTNADLAALQQKSGVVFGNGEEHRHNFEGYGEGYGHVMLLNIRKLIQPVSIGPGIMKAGTDGLPLARGIETARNDGATVVWCHNDMGREALPNILAGRVQAQNIYDGGMNSSFKDSFYRYLNIGLRVPFSTGTDWFQYDFSRTYVEVDGELTVENWLKSLAAGRSFITNGPLLEFHVNGQGIGSTISLDVGKVVRVRGRAVGRADFEQIEIIHNGEVKWTAPARRIGKHYEAELEVPVPINEPSWLALRTPPPPIERDPDMRVPVGKNEFGRWLYAHTSAVYVNIAGQSRFDRLTAEQLLEDMSKDRDEVARIGRFADEQEKARVLDVYSDGIRDMERRIAESAR